MESRITEESQQVQKISPQAMSNLQAWMISWLGWEDSNLRMRAPKARALPLGDTPIDTKSTILVDVMSIYFVKPLDKMPCIYLEYWSSGVLE